MAEDSRGSTSSNPFRNSATSAARQLNNSVEITLTRIGELNQQAFAAARLAGRSSLDAYEKALQSFVDVEEQMARAIQSEWVQGIAGAQTGFLRNVGGGYLSAARDMLK